MSSAPRTWPAKSRRTSRVAGARLKRILPWALPTRKSSVGPRPRPRFPAPWIIDACYAKAHNALGNVYALRGDLEKAISAYRAALACDAELRDAYYGLGMALARRESLAEAIAQFEEVVRRDSTHARSHYALGQAYEQQGEAAAARLAYGAFVRHWRGDEKVLAAAQSRIAAFANTSVDYNTRERRSLPVSKCSKKRKHLFYFFIF